MKNSIGAIVLLAFFGCGEPESDKETVEIETVVPEMIESDDEKPVNSATPTPGGKHLEYHTGGQLKIEGQYDMDSKRTGLWKSYYENGIKWSESYYTAGKRDGHSLTFYPNGQVRYVGEYADDKQTGQWTFYDEKGAVTKEENH